MAREGPDRRPTQTTAASCLEEYIVHSQAGIRLIQ